MDLSKTNKTLRIDDVLNYKIKVIADKKRRSVNNMIEYMVAVYIEKYEADNGEIILPEEHGID